MKKAYRHHARGEQSFTSGDFPTLVHDPAKCSSGSEHERARKRRWDATRSTLTTGVALGTLVLLFAAACGSDAASDDMMACTGDDCANPDNPSGPTPAPSAPTSCTASAGAMPLSQTAGSNGWQWFPIAGTRCAGGSETGVAVDFAPGSKKLLIYLQPGGACYDDETCRGALFLSTGFAQAEFDALRFFGADNWGVFERSNMANPFRDYHHVFVPYCTGDVHGGSNTATAGGSERQFVGADNLCFDLQRVAPTFSDVEQVVLAGSSAGGYGAMLNYQRVVEAFPNAVVHLINDSAPPMLDALLKPCLQSRWRDLWNLAARIPQDCPACTTADGGGLSALVPFLASRHGMSRFAFLGWDEDETMRGFFGYGNDDPVACDRDAMAVGADSYRAALGEVQTQVVATQDNLRSYVVAGPGHTFLLGEANASTPGATGTSLAPELAGWLGQMLSGSPDWSDTLPD